MSLSKKQQEACMVSFEWNGIKLAANVDDVLLLRECFEIQKSLEEIANAEGFTSAEKLEALAGYAEQVVNLVNRVFGEGTAVSLWGNRVPVFEPLLFLAELNVMLGKAYDSMFAAYSVNKSKRV